MVADKIDLFSETKTILFYSNRLRIINVNFSNVIFFKTSLSPHSQSRNRTSPY